LDSDFGDFGNTSESFSTKSIAINMFEIFFVSNFGGGISLEHESEIIATDTRSIIRDLDQTRSPIVDIDTDDTCSGIECIFDEFFEYRIWSLDDFTSFEFVDEMIREFFY
jgi:hypothetical protein